MPVKTERIIIPVLGEMKLPGLVKEIMLLPEVQRLRHVSLSNIDSCSLTGIGGVSRYEHSLGTALLACTLGDRLHLDQELRAELVLAAGLHDVAAPGLGHLFEEGCKLAGKDFDHETRLRKIFSEDKDIHYQIYQGREVGFRKLVESYNLRPDDIFDDIMGEGRCGEAINGSMDLDNIDNVTRMLSRLGRHFDRDTVLRFVEVFQLVDTRIRLNAERVDLFENWLALRRQLYEILMLEPTDFVAKAMTKIAVATGLRENVITPSDWSLTDADLLRRLRDDKATKSLVSKLLLGEYFRLINLFWVRGQAAVRQLSRNEERESLQRGLGKLLGQPIHIDFIRDKREGSVGANKSCEGALVGIISERKTPARREREKLQEWTRDYFDVVAVVFPASSSPSLPLPFVGG